MAEVVYDYTVEFVDDDTTISIVITEETADLDHDNISKEAEKRLCEMWGVKQIPSNYTIVNVEVHEVEI